MTKNRLRPSGRYGTVARMDAQNAVQELIEVSPQIEAAVVVSHANGTVIASSVDDTSGVQRRLANLGQKLHDQADRARIELGREPVVQCEIATGDATVFVVSDATNVVLAVADGEPTVGLVLYDLKTVLRNIRESASSTGEGGNR